MNRMAFAQWNRISLMLCVVAMGLTTLNAHNIDTSYARVVVASNRVELRLTLDLFTLLNVTNLDPNGDQRITQEEWRTAVPHIESYLRGAVLYQRDGRASELGVLSPVVWPAGPNQSIPADQWHSTNGLVTFAFSQNLTGTIRQISLGFDFFETFGQRHIVLGVFEHQGRSREVVFSQHQPDFIYDIVDAHPSSETSTPPGTASGESLGAALVRFLLLGVEHIFLGYDHLCFLVALVVVSRLGELVKIVTSFTVAHSITLILAALKIVALPSRLIECAIALTILYVAAENLWSKRTGHRWMLTFGFGLIHGFGFANVLSGLGLPTTGTVRCLLSFNVGVELGQLAIVLLLLPFTLVMARWRHGRKMAMIISAAVGVFGLGWFTERLLNTRLMPF